MVHVGSEMQLLSLFHVIALIGVVHLGSQIHVLSLFHVIALFGGGVVRL